MKGREETMNEKEKKEFQESVISYQDQELGYDGMKVLVDYLFHQIYLKDPALTARFDLVNPHQSNEMYKKMFRSKHGITTDEEFNKKCNEAREYITTVRDSLIVCLRDITVKDASKLMNSVDACDEFIKDFITDKEELVNDSFL